ncbi:hypothetical protein CALCODRAFT_140665 [Calocera cornea HHB12733]|uniref:Uncharacterized protein n=1 Tax=Calocera cornea HHB12733 TaxID=1353952 RepID=A0A165K515_9BASI|nr:hypothetical protein CALCODRAFT_140665 [Calocera cornea HHB12733]
MSDSPNAQHPATDAVQSRLIHSKHAILPASLVRRRPGTCDVPRPSARSVQQRSPTRYQTSNKIEQEHILQIDEPHPHPSPRLKGNNRYIHQARSSLSNRR